MKSEESDFIFEIFNDFGIIDFICFGFLSFVFILDIHFSRKKLVLINLNAVIKICSKMWKLCIHLDYDHFVYSINFQKMQNTNLFLLSLLLCGSRFLKKNHQLFRFEISLQQASR